MTAVISRLNLSKTKLEKKPDYEEILNVIHPDVKVHIPNRKSSDYFKSHFNITYGSLSDERVKQMEHQLLVEKFSKTYGFNKAATEALLHANSLTAAASEYGTAAEDSEEEEEAGGGGDGGGGGGGMKIYQTIADIATKYVGATIRPDTVINYIKSVLGGGGGPSPSPQGGAVSYDIGTPPRSPLFSFQQYNSPVRDFLILGRSSKRRRQLLNKEYTFLTEAERQYLIALERFQNQQLPYIPSTGQVLTPERQVPQVNPQMQGRNLEEAFDQAAPSGAQSAAPSQGSLPPLIAIDPVDNEANKILQKDATENIENEDEDFDSTILNLYAEAHGVAASGSSAGRKKTAQDLIDKIDELGTFSTHKEQLRRIIATKEYKQFEAIKKVNDMTALERKNYENQLHRAYLEANDDVKRAMKKWRYMREIIYRKNRGATQQAAGQVVAEPEPAPQTGQPTATPRRSGRSKSMGAKRGSDGLSQATEPLQRLKF
jgi:hypothetical protein